MKRTVLLLTILAFAALAAGDPPGFNLWTAAQLKGLPAAMAPKMNAQKLTSEPLAKWSNHSLLATYREGDGEAEVHEKQVDIFIVHSGEASLVVGGQVVGGKSTAPGEIRGPSIKGGVNRKLSPGDIVHIPARLPHQVLVKPGQKFTYLIVKVDAQ